MPPGPIMKCSEAANSAKITSSVSVTSMWSGVTSGASARIRRPISPASLVVPSAGRSSGSAGPWPRLWPTGALPISP